MGADIDPFDLSAAYLRRAQGDLQAFMEGLAARLEPALPDAVAVTRKRKGLFSSEMRTTAIAVTTPAGLLTLSIDGGRLAATRTSVVRGVAIGSKAMTVPDWLDELSRSIGTTGSATEEARASLHAFLVS
jgi:hypothetical protein